MQISTLLNSGSNFLKNRNIKSHILDSELLLSSILKRSREDLILNSQLKVSQKKAKLFNDLIERRSNREPIAYILKEKEFWSKNFFVNSDTLIPRPETELLVEKIVQIYNKKNILLLDIGTGSGCIIISILSELKKSRGIGIDVCSKALKVAKINAKHLDLEKRIKFENKKFEHINRAKFDLIVSNPPYIKNNELKNLEEDVKNYEPELALKGGNDGLDVIKKVIYKSKNILKIKGMLALEIGSGQFKKVSKILRNNNFKIDYLIVDCSKNIRGVISTLLK